jgi:hypothetical protein
MWRATHQHNQQAPSHAIAFPVHVACKLKALTGCNPNISLQPSGCSESLINKGSYSHPINHAAIDPPAQSPRRQHEWMNQQHLSTQAATSTQSITPPAQSARRQHEQGLTCTANSSPLHTHQPTNVFVRPKCDPLEVMKHCHNVLGGGHNPQS